MIKLNSSSADIRKAAEILKNGGLVAFPTETVYGLGADAFNANAIARVFKVKDRPRFDPLIIHIASLDFLERIVSFDNIESQQREQLFLLVHSFWPGPLTLVLPRQKEVPDLATAGLPTAAVRFPSHPVAQDLIALSTGAVAAPSANPFGRLSPSRAEHVIETLGNSIDCILDGGPCSVGVESTVLELFPDPRILRLGGIGREQLEAVIGPVAIHPIHGTELKCDQDEGAGGDLKCDRIKSGEQFAVSSPGMLLSHYAPGISLFLYTPEKMAAIPHNQKEAYLFFSGKNRDIWLERTNVLQMSDNGSQENIYTLSETGNITEAAANLFQFLHIVDKSGVNCIHAETVPEEGIGEAINDRLRRAAAKLNK